MKALALAMALFGAEPALEIREHPSPNHSARERGKIGRIVLHTTEGTGAGAEAWLTNPQSGVSAHYLVLETGEVVRLVRDDRKAWHCRENNDDSVGIEIAGYHDRPMTEPQKTGLRTLLTGLDKQYNFNPSDVYAHSGLDPGRRKDPGSEKVAFAKDVVVPTYNVKPAAASEPAPQKFYTVRPGDTYWSIARTCAAGYGMSVGEYAASLEEMNGFKPTGLPVGAKLRVQPAGRR